MQYLLKTEELFRNKYEVTYCFYSWSKMSNPGERLNYVQDSSSDTETDKETGSRGRHRIYKNRMRYYVKNISIMLQV